MRVSNAERRFWLSWDVTRAFGATSSTRRTHVSSIGDSSFDSLGGWFFCDAHQQLFDSPADYLRGYFAGDASDHRTQGLKFSAAECCGEAREMQIPAE